MRDISDDVSGGIISCDLSDDVSTKIRCLVTPDIQREKPSGRKVPLVKSVFTLTLLNILQIPLVVVV